MTDSILSYLHEFGLIMNIRLEGFQVLPRFEPETQGSDLWRRGVVGVSDRPT